MNLNYNKLFYFYEVARSLNITQTAQRLFLSQPALSKAMRELQETIGVELLTRRGRHLELTPAGEVLQAECEAIFGREEELLRRVRAAAGAERETIRFGYLLFNEIYHMHPVLRQFEDSRAGVEVATKRYTERSGITADLLHGRLDIGLNIFTMDDVVPELGYHILAYSRLAVAVPADHWCAGRAQVSLYDLEHENFISLGIDGRSTEFAFAQNWCRRCGFEPSIVAASEQVETVLTMIQSKVGISLLSDLAPVERMSHIALVPLENAPSIYAGLFWNKAHLSPESAALMKFYIERRAQIVK